MNFIKNLWKNIFPAKFQKNTLYPFGFQSSDFFGASFLGKDIHVSDFINNAISAIAQEVSKISINSIVSVAGSIKVQNDDITRLFRNAPNPLQTTSDFLSLIEWQRRKHCNVFILPKYELIKSESGKIFKRYTAFYPLIPSSFEVGVLDNSEVVEIKFNFSGSQSYIIPYSELIHLKWRRGNNVLLGGDDNGRLNNTELLRTVDALSKTIEGLPKAIEASSQIKGVYHAKTMIEAEKLQKDIANLEKHISTSKYGIMALDLAGDFTPVQIKGFQVDSETMTFLKSVVQQRYGVSEAILSGDYTSTQNEAFYQKTIEDFIVQFEQAFTSRLFTQREIDIGHKVQCYYNKISLLTEAQKMERAEFAARTGTMTLNEINTLIFGIEPFEGGDVRLQSLNYVDSTIVNNYQLASAGGVEKQDLSAISQNIKNKSDNE